MIGFRIEQVLRSLRTSGPRRTARRIVNRYRKERGGEVPFRERRWLSREGFKAIDYVLYEFAEKDEAHRRTYVSDRAAYRLMSVNGEAGALLKNKLVFHRILEARRPSCPVPELLGLIRNGRLTSSTAPFSEIDREDVFARHSVVFLKPVSGCRGLNVRMLDRGDFQPALEETFRISTDPKRELRDHIVVGKVEQAAYSRAIFSGSSNTIRVVAIRDPRSRAVQVPSAVHRFGARATVPVDNWSRGGLSCRVDTATGEMGPGIRHPSLTGWTLESLRCHPDTGSRVEGLVIPRWPELLEAVHELMEIFPDLEYVAWDMLPTDTGWCVIEGNDTMDVDLLQIHGGLLENPDMRLFVEYHLGSCR